MRKKVNKNYFTVKLSNIPFFQSFFLKNTYKNNKYNHRNLFKTSLNNYRDNFL